MSDGQGTLLGQNCKPVDIYNTVEFSKHFAAYIMSIKFLRFTRDIFKAGLNFIPYKRNFKMINISCCFCIFQRHDSCC